MSVKIVMANNADDVDKTLEQQLKDISCYAENVVEALNEFRAAFIDPETGGLVDIKFTVAIELIQQIWNKVKETSEECTGNTIDIQLQGDSPLIFVLNAVLAGIGFKL
jgi:hypothetical protein